MSSIVIPTPVARDGLLYLSSGYVGDRKRPLYAIRPGAQGDITLKDGEDNNEYVVWWQAKGGPYNPSPIVYGDAAGATAFTSSPWANNGKIFCLSEDGDTFVIAAGPEFKVLGKNELEEMCMATPAAVRGSLIIRTISKLYRIKN